MNKNNSEKLRPKKRIVRKAAELFYFQGFPTTHIGKILEESSSHKKSFYQYFRDKNHLAFDYLDFQEDRILKNTERLSRKFNSYEEFIKHWMSFNRKLFQSSRFAGCPFANFTLQTLYNQENFLPRIQRFMLSWENLFVHFLTRLEEEGKFSNSRFDKNRIAKRVILLYEGGIHTYLMSRDLEYLKLAEEEMLSVVES